MLVCSADMRSRSRQRARDCIMAYLFPVPRNWAARLRPKQGSNACALGLVYVEMFLPVPLCHR